MRRFKRAEALLSATMEGKDKDELNGTEAVDSKAIVSVSTSSLAEIDPVGGAVGSSLKARAVDQCFQQKR